MSRRSSYPAFTLIELLVVIAIIAILAAILFPVFAKAREKARQASCQSNVKQMGVAVQQYIQDYDEMLPPTAYTGVALPYPNGTTGTTYLWYHPLQPYIKNVQLLNCPSYPGTPYTGGYHPPGGYGGNQNSWGRALATFNYPSEHGLIMDGGWNRTAEPDLNRAGSRSDSYYLLDWDPQAAVSGGDNSMAPNPRHNLTTNVVFLDGHAKAMNTNQLITDSTAYPTDAFGSHFWNPTVQ